MDHVACTGRNDLQRCSNHLELGDARWMEHASAHSTPSKGTVGGCNVLMGATAGYLQIGLTAALIMSAVVAVQPGSFTSVGNQNINAETVPNEASYFSAVNYFAFSCLTTVGFGDIRPELPLSRMLSVTTSIIGPLYLAAVMGILIGRYSSNLKEGAKADDQITSRSENSPT